MGIKGQLVECGKQFANKMHAARSAGEITNEDMAEIEMEVGQHYETTLRVFLDERSAFDPDGTDIEDEVIDVPHPTPDLSPPAPEATEPPTPEATPEA